MSRKKRVVLLNCKEYPGINCHPRVRDDLLADQLRLYGFEVIADVWDDASKRRLPTDIFVVRVIVDYPLKKSEFIEWLDVLERENAQIINPVPVLRWNMHKAYLLELAERGIKIAETKIVTKGSGWPELAHFVKSWGEIIIKPCVANGGFLLKRLQTTAEAEEYQDTFRKQLATRDFLIQKYIDGIRKYGEWSLIYFNRYYSHCVVKFPPPGEFCVCNHEGGTVEAATPTERMLLFASRALLATPGKLAYARVDVLCDMQGELYLSEVELIEPTLTMLMLHGSLLKPS